MGIAGRAAVGLVTAALVFINSTTRMIAEETSDKLKEWSSVPPGSSGLVFTIEQGISYFEIANPSKGRLSSWKWSQNVPFVRQYRVTPGRYEIRLVPPFHSAVGLAPPLYAITVDANEGGLTYITLGAFLTPSSSGQEPVIPMQVTVSSGGVPAVISQWLEKAYRSGDDPKAYFVERLPDVADHVLLVSTEPPWQIPPPPKK